MVVERAALFDRISLCLGADSWVSHEAAAPPSRARLHDAGWRRTTVVAVRIVVAGATIIRTATKGPTRDQRGMARVIVQGSGLRTCWTWNRDSTNRRKPQRLQWLTWPGCCRAP